ncbi:MAG: hypothetical protein H6735_13995 [Alphaproteobacteria bacterium]|nr:hypothetical protein [Alphaproteobacteria bacterium]
MRTTVALAALWGCAPPELAAVTPASMFDGGDGLSVSEDRVLRGTLTEDTHLDADEPWILDGLVLVGEDGGASVDLTIEPGTTIFGNPTTRGTLVVNRGSRLIADGTASAPIVFTSPRARGARRAGDWGGLVLDGYAPVNGCTSTPCEREGEANSGMYGGDDPADDSGILRYVRVEFAGALYDLENELNGIAFQGVGNTTIVDHVQVHVSSDDGIEFFGGTVDVKHVVITGAGDDSLDWTGGWRGRVQHVAIQQHPSRGDRGLEADNNEDDHDATPRSGPVIANLTLIGQEGSGIAFNFRRGTGVNLLNSVVTGFDVCVDIDDDATWDNGYAPDGTTLNGQLMVERTWLNCTYAGSTSTWNGLTVDDFLAQSDGIVIGDPALVDSRDVDAPDFVGASALQSGAEPIDDPFFDTTSHVGAIGSSDWTAGWTTAGTD